MKKIKLAIVGCAGRMGNEIIKQIENFPNCELVSAIEEKKSKHINKKVKKIIISDNKEIAFQQADIIIDFSSPKSSIESAKFAAKLKKKLVIGTTGLNNVQINNIKKASGRTAIVFAPNMSIGINLLLALVKSTSKVFFNNETSIEILDIHHKHKKDAPSGTALALGNAIAREKNMLLKKLSDEKPNKKRKKQIGKINFFCKRQGNIVGEHSIIFTNKGEKIEIKHKGFNRSIYAMGAIKAGVWLHNQNKKKGFYKMFDILGIS